LEVEELPFINGKIGMSLINFDQIKHTVSYGGYRRNSVIGAIGPMPITKNTSISMMWETGKSVIQNTEANFCNYDESDCYTARTLPVIFNVSSHQGYSTGGLNITVQGHGFINGTIDAKVDGIPCKIKERSEDSFKCLLDTSPTVSNLTKSYVGQ
jgi:hypothetical protein